MGIVKKKLRLPSFDSRHKGHTGNVGCWRVTKSNEASVRGESGPGNGGATPCDFAALSIGEGNQDHAAADSGQAAFRHLTARSFAGSRRNAAEEQIEIVPGPVRVH